MRARGAPAWSSLLALALSLGLAGCSKDGPTEVPSGPPVLLAFLSERPPSYPFTTDIYLYDLSRGGPVTMPPNVNSLSVEGPCALSANGNTLAFYTNRILIGAAVNLLVCDVPSGRISMPLRINQLALLQNPALSGDGRFIAAQYQISNDLYVAVQDLSTDSLLPLPRLNEPNTYTFDPALSGDGDLIAVCSSRLDTQGGFDIYLYSVSADSFLALPNLNSPGNEFSPSLSADGRYLAFQSRRVASVGLVDVYVYDRQTQSLLPLPGANTQLADFQPTISPDGRYLAFTTEATGGQDVRVYDIVNQRLLTLDGLNDPYYYDSFPALAGR